MDATATRVAACFRDRTILVTGSTGFLGKLLVEKILRLQPDVKKLYLLVRAQDAAAAHHRVIHDIAGNELFRVLREKHGADFHSFISDKISPLAGDMTYENLGLESTQAKQLFQEIDIIINGAGTTSFYERYDVALASNTFGTAHMCRFARQCLHLKLLLHISTAYVAGNQKGLLLEKPLQMGQTVKKDRCLDIEAELQLATKVKAKLGKARSDTHTAAHQKREKVAMKELGLKRAKYFGWPNAYAFTKAMGEMLLGTLKGDLPVVIIRPSIILSTFHDPFPGWIEGIRTMDVMIAASNERKLPCFIHGPMLDAIPGDMVVNATMAAIAAHYGDTATQVVYHVSSGLRNPLSSKVLEESVHAYFFINPPTASDGKSTAPHKMPLLFSRYAYFNAYMVLAYKSRLQALYLANYLLVCGRFTEYHTKLNRSLNYLMFMAKLYAPYVFFEGRFDGTNLRKLWGTMIGGAGHGDDGFLFNFDPGCINWRQYLFNTHVPAVLKVADQLKKQGRA